MLATKSKEIRNGIIMKIGSIAQKFNPADII